MVPFIREISSETLSLLHRIYKHSRHHQVRQRAHCLILRHQGLSVIQLMDIFLVSRKTLYNWFNTWEARGVVGLYNRPGRGRKPTFTSEQKQQIREWTLESPNQLKTVVQRIQQEWDKTVSTQTVKRILKSLQMSWHRLRRVVGGQPDPEEYKAKKAQLDVLKKLDDTGEIDLYYLDEAGFSLFSAVPYGWQPIGETLGIPAQKSPRINVLGIMTRDNQLEAYVSTQSINSPVIIACIDTFFPIVDKRTVIVMDQSSVHTSRAMQDRLDTWKQRNIEIFELPTYSPQLNLIEILWRFIKYDWMEISAYKEWQALVEYVERVLREFGNERVINFA